MFTGNSTAKFVGNRAQNGGAVYSIHYSDCWITEF